jgi:YHS domain-containing protein
MEAVVYFLLWAGLFFLVMRFGCGAHVMGHGHKHHRSSADRTMPVSDGGFASPEKDIDPVCGMEVEAARAKSSLFGGRAYYFCSASCREKFEANPRAFAQKPGRDPQPMEDARGSHH